MRLFYLAWITLSLLTPGVVAQAPGASSSPSPEPKKSIEWFQRAAELMDLRVPGASPFHLSVKFHAFPGEEMQAANNLEIVTGDGVYEETWLDLHRWRREVTLGIYHAVEVEGNGFRKMDASSDYEPSRVLMLLNALLTPVPRDLTSRESKSGNGWKIEPVSAGDLALVRLSKSMGNQHADYTDSMYFFPKGMLAMSNSAGMVISRASFVAFGSKVVPRSLAMKAGERDLLSAEISIAQVGTPDPALFDLEGGPAEPGTTLRALHWTDVRIPDLNGSYAWMTNTAGPSPVYSLQGVLDRHGRFRELEVIVAPNPRDVAILLSRLREDRKKPATIDGTVCQIVMQWRMM